MPGYPATRGRYDVARSGRDRAAVTDQVVGPALAVQVVGAELAEDLVVRPRRPTARPRRLGRGSRRARCRRRRRRRRTSSASADGYERDRVGGVEPAVAALVRWSRRRRRSGRRRVRRTGGHRCPCRLGRRGRRPAGRSPPEPWTSSSARVAEDHVVVGAAVAARRSRRRPRPRRRRSRRGSRPRRRCRGAGRGCRRRRACRRRPRRRSGRRRLRRRGCCRRRPRSGSGWPPGCRRRRVTVPLSPRMMSAPSPPSVVSSPTVLAASPPSSAAPGPSPMISSSPPSPKRRVVAAVAPQLVAARAAADLGVVAGLAGPVVVAVVAEQPVGVRATPEVVVAVRSRTAGRRRRCPGCRRSELSTPSRGQDEPAVASRRCRGRPRCRRRLHRPRSCRCPRASPSTVSSPGSSASSASEVSSSPYILSSPGPPLRVSLPATADDLVALVEELRGARRRGVTRWAHR